MSKKKKEKLKKSEKKNSDKKAVKKALNASSNKIKSAAKNISKSAKPKKATVVKKASVKAAKPIKSSKKSPVKASKPKVAAKVLPKKDKSKKVAVKNPAPKKADIKKIISKKKEVKPVVKYSKSVIKPSKVVSKPVKKGQNPVDTKKTVAKAKEQKPVETKKVAAKVIASSSKPSPTAPGSFKKEIPPPSGKKAEDTATKKSAAEAKAQNVLAISNTIPVATKSELPASKIASISHSITNPVKKTDSYSVKAEKEPNGKFELEFVVHSSAEMLYEFLSTPSGLSEWFCDDLNIRNGIYTFIWDDQLQQARLLKTIELQVVRFQWVDKTDGSYFEFRIQRDDLTNDISLIITDFAETVSERESSKLLWHSQVEKLMHVIGSIF